MKDDDVDKSEMLKIEIPLPEDHYRRLGIASRPTFYRWEQQGLDVLRVGGRRFIYPSELRRFMELKNEMAKQPAGQRLTSSAEPSEND